MREGIEKCGFMCKHLSYEMTNLGTTYKCKKAKGTPEIPREMFDSTFQKFPPFCPLKQK